MQLDTAVYEEEDVNVWITEYEKKHTGDSQSAHFSA